MKAKMASKRTVLKFLDPTLGSILGTISIAKKNEVWEELIPESTRFHFAILRTIRYGGIISA